MCFSGCWLLLQLEGAMTIIVPEQHQKGNSESKREQCLEDLNNSPSVTHPTPVASLFLLEQ